jgi:hypothetical protein
VPVFSQAACCRAGLCTKGLNPGADGCYADFWVPVLGCYEGSGNLLPLEMHSLASLGVRVRRS